MFKRIFLSKTTVIITTICIVVLSIGSFVSGRIAGLTNWYDYFDDAMKILLSVFLFYGYMRHDLLAMQAGCCGLLTCSLYYQGQYVLDELICRDPDTFINLGFFGSLFLAVELMIFFLEFFILTNHFVLYIMKKQNLVRITVNQSVIVILFAFLLLQLFINSQLLFDISVRVYYGVDQLYTLAVYVLILCAELILVLDDEEGGRA